MLISKAFRRAFDFSGRSSRAEYWQFMALVTALSGAALVLDVAENGSGPTFTMTVLVVLLVPIYSVSFRRLHDRGMSGWWIGATTVLNMSGGVIAYLQGRSFDTPMASVFGALSMIQTCAMVGISLYLLLQACLPAQPGFNRFGAPPSDDDAENVGDTGARAAAFVAKLGKGDPLTQIERLSKLRQAGALTDDEFAEQKAALLKRI